MRKSLMLCMAALLAASVVNAASFKPNILRLSAPATVQYQFTGSKLDIPFDVTGTPAAVMISVYTNGKASTVNKVTNGFLGWHYMNQVDTSIYVSPIANYGTGKNNIISWTGKDKDGNLVPAGDYTYYLWAYDNKDARVSVCAFIRQLAGAGGNQGHIQEIGTDGKILVNPVFLGWYGQTKWTIGNDPQDRTLFETTTYTLGSGFSVAKVVALQPNDFTKFYLQLGNATTKVKGVRKMLYVPNGASLFDTTWGTNGMTSWSGTFDADGGCISDGDVVYTVDNAYHGLDNKALADFYYIDGNDGSIIKKVDMTSWWSSVADQNAGAQLNGGPNGYDIRNHYLFLNSHSSCLKQMVDPSADTLVGFFKWTNKNGDYEFDKNWETTSSYKWACNDYRAEPETYHFSADRNLFSTASVFDLGAVSFGLLGPDGTTMGYYSFAGELSLGALGAGRWHITVDSGSAYDGLYTDNYAAPDTSQQGGIWYVAQNSVKGLITNKAVGVKETAPSAFSVSQNSPNPFNPATTISFVIPKAGDVTVEVFNVGGQKVDTLVNSRLEAGSHSVTWNAIQHSAGMYFCTVKTKDASKTMKMTLLK